MDVIGNCSIAPCYSQSPPPADFSTVFLDFRFLHQQLKVRWGPDFVYIISLFTFESGIVLSLITLYKNASKGGKPNRKPYHPYGFRIYAQNSINEENSSLFMNIILDYIQKPQRHCIFILNLRIILQCDLQYIQFCGTAQMLDANKGCKNLSPISLPPPPSPPPQ